MFISIPEFLTDAEKKAELESAITAVKEHAERFQTYIERKATELTQWEADLERRENELKGQIVKSTEAPELRQSHSTVVKQNPSSASDNHQSQSDVNASQLVQLSAKGGRGRPLKVARGEPSAPKTNETREKGQVEKKQKSAGANEHKKRDGLKEDSGSSAAPKKEVKKSKRPATAWTLWYAENKGRLMKEARAKGIRGSGSVVSLGAKEWNGLEDKAKWEEMALEEKEGRLAEGQKEQGDGTAGGEEEN